MKMGKNRKLRIIVNGVGLFLTIGQLANVICTTKHLDGIGAILSRMEKEKCNGVAMEVDGVFIQVDLL